MPRVVQIPSSDSSDGLEGFDIPRDTLRSDSSESESDRNRNFNQRMSNGVTESLSSYLNYTVNYLLYNVTYNDVEDDPYCLTCIIDGRVRKFKKDARVWLHKSSDRKRKLEHGDCNTRTTQQNGDAGNRDRELESIREQIRKLDSETFINKCKQEKEKEVKSELSSLADSEAELAYSEDSTSGIDQAPVDSNNAHADVVNTTSATKTVRFDNTVDVSNAYRVTTESSSSDDCVHTVGSRSTVSYRSLLSEDDSNQISRIRGDIDHFNESKNNFRSGIFASDMSRIAPAISIETESLNEGMLDYAVNLHNRSDHVTSSTGRDFKSAFSTDAGYRILQASQTIMLKMINKAKRGRVEKKVPARTYDLRSTKKNARRNAKQRIRKSRDRSTKLSEQNTKPDDVDSGNIHVLIECVTDEPNFNRKSISPEANQNQNSTRSVPTLLVLASRAYYKLLKSEYEIIK